ncbi:baseplate J/gp47 family protein [Massilia psychrophila]|uniref:Baseplate protein J-like domain-containing protein n=1 Tax=Massilia psychrophila TaxID=1603353 RepID=A0A2G8T4G8_9BURK|nr:baseplate J/gp47 family protein [Massilia psychrophila]PIL40879.1 hypothetical protein CR103_05375 [Massilia psychrophila]GGE72587.1 hypothetical protein GCM10008020_16560 [Massilia psychrophila]
MSSRSGTSQAQRVPEALAEHYVDVDELSLQQLLVVALDSARQVGFEGRAPGTSWENYFKDDEIVVFAEILATRVHAVTARFEQVLAQSAPATPDADALSAHMLQQWFGQLGRWSEILLNHGGVQGADLGAMLAGLRRQLGHELHGVGVSDGTPERGHPLEAAGGAPAAPPAQKPQLRAAFHQVMKAVEMAQRSAQARLPRALRSGQHDPGIGMLIAFAQLYRRAQEKLNRFTGRHLDFYYDQVLRVRPHGPERDAAFLVFEAAPPGLAIPVDGGTRFLAPYDRSAPELEFVTEHSMIVTDARVVALHTVFFERNRLSFPESRLYEHLGQRERRYPTACRLNPIALASPGMLPKDESCEAAPLFGAPRSAAMAPPGAVARIGFALASNVLLMRQGERKVDVVLHLGSDGTGPAGRLWQRMDGLLAEVTQAMKKSQAEQDPLTTHGTNANDPEILYRVLERMFSISVSGSAGWIDIAEYSAGFMRGAGNVDTLSLTFRLGAEAAAVVPYAPALHGEQYPGNCPMVRFELNALAYVYPYGLLRGLPLVRADIEVEVSGHRALELQNHIGLLSAASPFQPFGPLPAVGSYLIVGSAETACKNLTGFELVLEWGGLPRAVRGLGAYYAGYAGDARDGLTPFGDVRANLSVLSDGAWAPLDESERPAVTLFGAAAAPDATPAGASASSPVAAARRLRFDRVLPQGRRIGRVEGPAPFVYTSGARGGFFKITLAGPDFLFGHRDYPFILANCLSYNGQPRNGARLRELPAPPYTPLLDAIWLNYRATATIVAAPSAAGDAFLRLSPLGWDAARGAGHQRDLLLPRFDDGGNLYIGLSASDLRAPLTLFFHLREDALPMVELANRELYWSYLADNAWRPLLPYAVRADSTHAFLRAGIVTLTLPPDISCDNTDLQSGLFWLRVSCDTDLERFCSLYSISTHAAQVFRDLGAVAAPLAPASIAAGTITRPRQAIPGLGRLKQVTASYGGRLAESRHDMRRRTAERLRHKGQAITPEDYERLILQQFPAIDRVKCFANLSVALRPDGACCPGHVLIVGLPACRSNGHLAEFPRLNGYLIGQVRQFVEAHISPAVTLEVVNPVYQYIQVRCTLVLRAGADLGWYVNQLDALISDFISPWNPIGNTCHFGWIIRRHDIESFILAQDGVLAVSGFSMLSVSGRDLDLFSLKDTAAPGMTGEPVIEPTYPWSIAVPIKRHHITVKHAGAATPASPTGIGQMEIGSTFIIGGKRDEE